MYDSLYYIFDYYRRKLLCDFFNHHFVNEKVEDQLFSTPSGKLYSNCARCYKDLTLTIDLNDPDTYYIEY